MDTSKNYFEVFGLPRSFAIDLDALAHRYRELQREVHPDRHASAGDREQRLAVEYASFVNEAFEALQSPLARAVYLLRLVGVERDSESATTTDTAFLMQQMELREELSQVREQKDPEAALDRLSVHVDNCLQQLQVEFGRDYERGDYSRAQVVVDKMHFIFKLALEVEQLEVELLDY